MKSTRGLSEKFTQVRSLGLHLGPSEGKFVQSIPPSFPLFVPHCTPHTANFTKVFTLSLEEHLWGSVPCVGGPEAVLQELEVDSDTTTQLPEVSHWTCLPSTPPALVNKSVDNPSIPRC